jgi:hypothetical protein
VLDAVGRADGADRAQHLQRAAAGCTGVSTDVATCCCPVAWPGPFAIGGWWAPLSTEHSRLPAAAER